MKRYWLFCYATFYPLGAMRDFKGAYDTVEQCHEAYEKQADDNYEIFDIIKRLVVYSNWLPDYKEVHKPTDRLFDQSHLSYLYPEGLYHSDSE